jgi:glycosyltransferase involved in cell wall biosynthesis
VYILFVTREHEAEKRYGLGRSLAPLAHELERRGHRVRYLCQADLAAGARDALQRFYRTLHTLLRRPADSRYRDFLWVALERLAMGRLAARVAAREGCTHVHCHDPLIAAGYRWFARRPVAWGVTEHGFGCYMHAIRDDGVRFSPRGLRWARAFEARVLRAADWVIAPTRRALEQLVRDLGLAAVPAGWDFVYHARPPLRCYERDAARRRLGWDGRGVYVLGVGRLVGLKRFPLLIEACARLRPDRRVQLVLLGEGDREALKDRARAVGLEPEPVFALTDDIGLYLSAADLYVSASASESFGLATLEAMLCGTPALCAAVGGVPEVAGDGAWLVPADCDAATLAQAIERLLDDAEARAALAQRGRRRAEAWPGIEQVADIYEGIYRAAVARADRAL